jgi:hypothetical protein
MPLSNIQVSNIPGDFDVCFLLRLKSSCRMSSSSESSDSVCEGIYSSSDDKKTPAQ